MPPKKKPRLSSRAPSTLSVETPSEMVLVAPESGNAVAAKAGEVTPDDPMTDPWTDEQEISLFKGMIKWKPVGMHKHFRMLSISQHLRNHGHNPKSEPHTGIPGIWKKLASLYNLKVLDERENSYGEYGSEDHEPGKEPFVPFSLPSSDFGDLMFERRLAATGSSSPPSLPHQLLTEGHSGRRRPSMIDDSEGKPRSSPASARGAKGGRGRGRGGRRSMLHKESTPTARSASKASVDASGDGEDQEEEEEEDEDEEVSAEESGEGTPVSSTRGARGGRKPGRRGRVGRWRGGARRGGRHKK